MPAHPTRPLRWATGRSANSQRWTDTAMRMLAAGTLRLDDRRRDDDAVFLRGTCPRCRHDMVDAHPLSVVVMDADRWSRLRAAPLRWEGGEIRAGSLVTGLFGRLRRRRGGGGKQRYVFTCRCDSTHPGRPKDDRGCGVYFAVEAGQ